MAITPLLHQAGRAQPEFAKESFAIFAPGHEAAVVEALVILDSYQQIFRARSLFNLDSLLVPQDQRLDGADVLVVIERRHDHVKVQLVGHGNHHDLARRHGLDRVAIPFRLGTARGRQSTEGLAGKGAQQLFGGGQRLHGRGAPGADRNLADRAGALHVIQRREDLIVSNHAATDDGDLRLDHATAEWAWVASAKASSNAETLSRIASFVITSGGAIFTVAPPSPTGVNMSTPFSTAGRPTSQRKSPSGC